MHSRPLAMFCCMALAACGSAGDDGSSGAPGDDAGSSLADGRSGDATPHGDARSDDGSVTPDSAQQPADGSSGESGANDDAAALPDTGVDASADSGCPVPADPLAGQRAACTFATGALVRDTLGLSDPARAAIPIKHVIVLMKENRAFDHLLGLLHDEGQPAVEAIPASFTNVDDANAVVAPFHEPTTCVAHDPDHQWAAMHTQVNSGQMDGFVKSAAASTGTDGHFVMGHYEQADLPFYYWLASTFALNDRHFASARSGTFPNRNFLLLGTADGVMSTGAGYPDPSTPTVFDAMDKAGVTWGVYSDGSLLSGTLGWVAGHPHTGSFAEFLSALDGGTLPQVAFVDGIDNVEDEHPTANVQQGEAWTRSIYTHAVASKLWPGLAIVWTYDEGGGFADHVPPPNKACIARPIAKDQPFFELGVRVPLAVVSPWARPHYVSHVVQDHTAITRFIEAVFGLPALTARDANSDALLDLFDFACGPAFATGPVPPAAGTGGCGGNVILTTSKPTYAKSEPIVVSFSGGPANNPKDWIGVYPYPASGPTPPQPGSTLYNYIGGQHNPTTAPASGTVTLDQGALGKGPWPLPAGGYIAYYLLNDGYTSVASIDFNVSP
jgi:phospholipase C